MLYKKQLITHVTFINSNKITPPPIIYSNKLGVSSCITPSGITSSLYKIILGSIIVRVGCGLFIEASVSIYSSK